MCLWQDVYISAGMYEVVETFCMEASSCMRLPVAPCSNDPIRALVNRLVSSLVPAARVEESGRTYDAADHQVETLFLAGVALQHWLHG